MRITSQMLVQDALRGLRANRENLRRAHEDVTTGHRIRSVSDGPTDAAALMRLESQLRSVDRYQRAIALAGTRLSTEEAALKSIAALVDQAKGAALTDSPPGSPASRAAAAEVRAVRDQMVAIGNTQVMGEYIFAGTRVGSPPFLPDGSYVGNSEVNAVEIGDQLRIELGHPGDRVFADAISILDRLARGLETGTPEMVSGMLAELDTSRQDVQTARSEVASRLHELAAQGQHLARIALGFENREEELDQIDPAEAIVRLTQARDTLEQSYAAIAKALSTNILEYLR